MIKENNIWDSDSLTRVKCFFRVTDSTVIEKLSRTEVRYKILSGEMDTKMTSIFEMM